MEGEKRGIDFTGVPAAEERMGRRGWGCSKSESEMTISCLTNPSRTIFHMPVLLDPAVPLSHPSTCPPLHPPPCHPLADGGPAGLNLHL